MELSDGADQQQSCSGVVPRGPAICISEKPSVESIEYVACQPSDQAEVGCMAYDSVMVESPKACTKGWSIDGSA